MQCTVLIIVMIFSGDGVMPCYVEPPMIQGHEFVGEVIKLGPGIIIHIRIIHTIQLNITIYVYTVFCFKT